MSEYKPLFHKVVECPKCCFIQSCYAKKVFKCQKCGRTTKMIKSGSQGKYRGVRLHDISTSPQRAGIVTRYLKEKDSYDQGLEEEFHSHSMNQPL